MPKDAGPDAAPPVDASVGVAPDTLERIGDCDAKHPPGPPQPDQITGTDESIPELVLAGLNIESGDEDVDGEPRWHTLGYDLDGACSDQPKAHACSPAEWAPPGAAGTTDVVNGIDNAMGQAFHMVHHLFQSGSATLHGNTLTKAGHRTFIVRIGDYNGEPFDAQVTVALFVVTMATPGATPQWMGKDEWHGRDAFFVLEDGGLPEPGAPLPEPRYVVSDAYVTGQRLVARFAEAGSEFGLFRHLIVTGTLHERKGFGWVLDDGLMAGRVPIDSLLATAGTMFLPSEKKFLCTDHPDYPDRKAALCALADVSYEGDDSASAPCDGASWAWKFDTVPAKLVGVTKYVDETEECGVGKYPGIDDHCDPSLNGDAGSPL